MEKRTLKLRIKQNPALKQVVHRFIMHPVKTRPNWWIRLFYFVYLKRGKGSVIYRSVRKDLPPFNQFSLGRYSVVEDFSCLNNAVGDLIIGDYTRIGLGNTIIGPVLIGNHVNLAQHVTVTGLNHNYQDAEKSIDEQGVSTQPVTIEDDVWGECWRKDCCEYSTRSSDDLCGLDLERLTLMEKAKTIYQCSILKSEFERLQIGGI